VRLACGVVAIGHIISTAVSHHCCVRDRGGLHACAPQQISWPPCQCCCNDRLQTHVSTRVWFKSCNVDCARERAISCNSGSWPPPSPWIFEADILKTHCTVAGLEIRILPAGHAVAQPSFDPGSAVNNIQGKAHSSSTAHLDLYKLIPEKRHTVSTVVVTVSL